MPTSERSFSLGSLLSREGEMGRDDYFLSLLWRSIPIILMNYSFKHVIPAEQVEGYYYLNIFAAFYTFLMIWPVIFRRKNDLGSKLSKSWLNFYLFTSIAQYFTFTLIPMTNVGLEIFNLSLGIASLVGVYPGFKLLLIPGKKYVDCKNTPGSKGKSGGSKVTVNDT